MSVCVCLLVHGSRDYYAVAREAVASIHDHSDFDVMAVLGPGGQLPGQFPRLARLALLPEDETLGRPYRFLMKFNALKSCLDAGNHEFIVLMDADVVLTRRLDETAIAQALGDRGLGMVVQPRVRGGETGPAELHAHYLQYAHALIAPDLPAPPRDGFRYFNSGVVIARRDSLEDLVDWALADIGAKHGRHEPGPHMVADQDYFQVWANVLHPECAVELPWYWNHCEHWDDGFPRDGVLLAHFSNFCNGPARHTRRRMRKLRGPAPVRWWRRVARRPRGGAAA